MLGVEKPVTAVLSSMALRRADVKARRRHGSQSLVTLVMAGLALRLLSDMESADCSDAAGSSAAFATPIADQVAWFAASSQSADRQGLKVGQPLHRHFTDTRGTRDASQARVARKAAVVPAVSIGTRVLNAMGAGAVAAVIQAMLAACTEPIINRVLVRRMRVMEAIKDVKPYMITSYFKTTIVTNLLKFPLFEAINAFCQSLPIPASIRGIVTGLIFATSTLPITNFRYRKSMQLPVEWGNIYEAYLPTVLRDIAYGIARNYATAWALAMNPTWKATSPQLLFFVVLVGCLGSAPFNELRGYLLQSKGQKISFGEFFKPANFIRSTSLGALKQAIALGVGYWLSPVVQGFVWQLLGRA